MHYTNSQCTTHTHNALHMPTMHYTDPQCTTLTHKAMYQDSSSWLDDSHMVKVQTYPQKKEYYQDKQV